MLQQFVHSWYFDYVAQKPAELIYIWNILQSILKLKNY